MKRKVALGPGAASLILIIVVLSLCMMAMLAQIGARNDYNLCRRSAEMVRSVYELNSQSERKLAELDAILVTAKQEADGSMEAYLEKVAKLLPKDMSMDNGQVTWMQSLGNRYLECIVKLLPPEEKQRTKWISHKLQTEEPEEDWE